MVVKLSRPVFYIGYLLAIVWSMVMIARSIKRIFVTGIKGYFSVKKRGVPAALQDPALGEHGFLQLSSVKLHYVSNGPADGPLMIFLHGFPEFWYSWRHQLKEFAKDYRAVAIDMRGYGDSDKPRSVKDYTMDKLVEDIREFVQGLGYEKCTLVGHDWGGMVAWNVAQVYPDLVDKLIVCNIPHSTAFLQHLQSSLKQLLMSWYIFFFQLPLLPELILRAEDLAFIKGAFGSRGDNAKRGAFTEADIELYKYVFSPPGSLNGPINYYRAIYRHGINVNYPTDKVTVPTLMVWGVKDRALAKVLAEKSAEFAEDYRVKYVEASHWVQQEEPEEVNQHMREFLNQY